MRAGEVSYNGKKSGDYVYGFPPIQYPDGKWRIKVGHSPVDPIIGRLGKTEDDPNFDKLDYAPSKEQVRAWYAGSSNDQKSPIVDDVKRRIQESEEFFDDILKRLFPNIVIQS